MKIQRPGECVRVADGRDRGRMGKRHRGSSCDISSLWRFLPLIRYLGPIKRIRSPFTLC